MNRRQFLLASSAAVAAGCGRGRPAAGPALPPDLRAKAADQQARREQHLATLERFRVPADAARTTPPPPLAVPQAFPQLKPLAKVALRLHPRFGDEPAADATKVGGAFLWPEAEAWPTDPRFGVQLAAVVQLRAEDAPPQVAFPPDTDLLQLLWCPLDQAGEGPAATVRWRKRAAVGDLRLVPAPPRGVFFDYVPVACRVFPERVTEYPPPELMPKLMRDKLADWEPTVWAGGEPVARFYADRLAAAPGVKVGGWPRWDGDPKTPTCPTCKRLTDFLLTVDSGEWDDRTAPRWRPAEERAAADAEGFRAAPGLRFGPDGRGRVHVFVCRQCPGWPAFSVVG